MSYFNDDWFNQNGDCLIPREGAEFKEIQSQIKVLSLPSLLHMSKD